MVLSLPWYGLRVFGPWFLSSSGLRVPRLRCDPSFRLEVIVLMDYQCWCVSWIQGVVLLVPLFWWLCRVLLLVLPPLWLKDVAALVPASFLARECLPHAPPHL